MKVNFPFLCLCLLTLFKMSFAQTNSSLPYCKPAYSSSPCSQPLLANDPGNWVNDMIDHFATSGGINDISNLNSGCSGMADNYSFYCQYYLQTNPGAVITCSFQSGITFGQGFALFIDWNQDNIFQNPGEKVIASMSVPPSATWFVSTFTVPTNQAAGHYRMRARCVYATSGTSIDPCTSFAYGETEGYNLFVGMSPPAGSVPSATISSNSPLCSGQTLVLTATVTGASTYSWTGPQNFSNSLLSPSISPAVTANSGLYNLSVSNGTCPLVLSTNVVVSQSPTVIINSNVNPLCSGSQSTLNVSGASQYTWSTGSNSSNIVVSPTTTTIYTLIAANGQCTTTASYTQSVVICAGIDDIRNNIPCKIFPVPFNDDLVLDCDKNYQITMFDVSGKEVLKAEN